MLGYLLSPVLQIEDTNGLPLVDGKVYVYEANTSNLATIYSNYEGTLNTNPAILDLSGHTTIIADDVMIYDITVKDKDDNLLFTAKDVAVGGEGGSSSVSDVIVKAGGNGISVVQSVENNIKVFTVYIDYSFVASKTDLNYKQDVLTPGNNISIENDVISVTGLKTISAVAPLQKTETASAINLSIDTSTFQPALSAGTNIDAVKLSNNILDLKSDNCSASVNGIAIGRETSGSGIYSFAAGYLTRAAGEVSHSEGYRTSANDYASHAEGENTIAWAAGAHAEGNGSMAYGNWSHAEGDHCLAQGWHAHAEGSNTTAYGSNSHAMGSYTYVLGTGSLAAGEHTSALGMNQTVFGRYNNPNDTDILQIGCGDQNNHLNALELRNDKSMWYYYEGDMVRLAPFRRYIPDESYLLNGSTDIVIVDYSGDSDSFQILGNDSEIAMIWADNSRDGTVYVDGSDTPVTVYNNRVKLKDLAQYGRVRLEIFGMGIGYYIPHWVYTIYRSTDRLHVYAEQVFDDIVE